LRKVACECGRGPVRALRPIGGRVASVDSGGPSLWPAGKGEAMFLVLFFILLVCWLLGFAAFHVAGGLIHLLLIVAVISLVVHFVSGRRAV
jgi:hypothetical protein